MSAPVNPAPSRPADTPVVSNAAAGACGALLAFAGLLVALAAGAPPPWPLCSPPSWPTERATSDQPHPSRSREDRHGVTRRQHLVRTAADGDRDNLPSGAGLTTLPAIDAHSYISVWHGDASPTVEPDWFDDEEPSAIVGTDQIWARRPQPKAAAFAKPRTEPGRRCGLALP